jgi:hypothetical protein
MSIYVRAGRSSAERTTVTSDTIDFRQAAGSNSASRTSSTYGSQFSSGLDR